MKTTTKRFTLPVLGLLGAMLAFNGATALATTRKVPDQYPTIQAAVNAAVPGDTVKVSAGIYNNESQIVINKALTVLGAGADVTIIDGGDAVLTEVGLVRITARGNVTLSGFKLRNAGGPMNSSVDEPVKIRVCLFARSPVAGNNYTITDNIIIGSGDDAEYEDYGVYAVGGLENLVFQQNLVERTGANAVVIELHAGPTDISYNTLDVGVAGADAIFTMTYNDLDVTKAQKRNNNVINVGAGDPPFDSGNRAGGITFASAYSGVLGGGQFTSIQILRNIIYNVQAERRGITLWNGKTGGNPFDGNIVSPQVEGNVISGVARSTAGSKGIQLLGLVSDARLSNNYLADLDIGIHLRIWPGPGGFRPSGTKISNNRFDDVGTRVKIDPDNVIAKNQADQTAPNAVGLKQHAGHLVTP